MSKPPSRLPPSPQFSCFYFLATFGREKKAQEVRRSSSPDGGTGESISHRNIFHVKSLILFFCLFSKDPRARNVYNSIPPKERKTSKKGEVPSSTFIREFLTLILLNAWQRNNNRRGWRIFFYFSFVSFNQTAHVAVVSRKTQILPPLPLSTRV